MTGSIVPGKVEAPKLRPERKRKRGGDGEGLFLADPHDEQQAALKKVMARVVVLQAEEVQRKNRTGRGKSGESGAKEKAPPETGEQVGGEVIPNTGGSGPVGPGLDSDGRGPMLGDHVDGPSNALSGAAASPSASAQRSRPVRTGTAEEVASQAGERAPSTASPRAASSRAANPAPVRQAVLLSSAAPEQLKKPQALKKTGRVLLGGGGPKWGPRANLDRGAMAVEKRKTMQEVGKLETDNTATREA